MRNLTLAALVILAGAAIVIGLRVTGMAERQLRNEAIAAGYIVIPGDASIGMPDMFMLPERKR